MQQVRFPDEKEHISEKRERSHHHLANCTYLLENVIESLEMEESEKYLTNVLSYMLRLQEVVAKYIKVCFDFKLNCISNLLADKKEIKPKVVAWCKLIIAMTQFITLWVNVIGYVTQYIQMQSKLEDSGIFSSH